MGIDELSSILEFDAFLRDFRTDNGEYKYTEKIREMISQNKTSLRIDFSDLIIDKPNLAQLLLEEPEKALEEGNTALTTIVRQLDETYMVDAEFFIRIVNLPDQYKLEFNDIRARHTEKMHVFEGLIIKVSSVKELLLKSCYRCSECYQTMYVNHENYKSTKPKICENPSCKKRSVFTLLAKQSKTTDHQIITIQRYPIPKKSSMTPSLEVILLDDLVDTRKKNTIVRITGYLLQWQKSRNKVEFERLLVANSIIQKDVLLRR
ncbi:MAG: hypothetical protein ACTSQX_15810 [Candidatus Heimdallarchaeota archaeon]